MVNGIVVKAVICALLFGSSVEPFAAQTKNLDQTGQVRAVISEAEVSTRDIVHFSRSGFPIRTNTKVDFYFVYSQNDTPAEKWIELPNDRDWSELSNRTVHLTGTLENKKLANVRATPLTM